MATPHRRSSGSEALNSGPPRHILQQLLEEINESSSTWTIRTKRPLPSPASISSWSPNQAQQSSVWVGGSPLALDAREKLRAVDEARWQNGATSIINHSTDPSTLRPDISELGSPTAAIGEDATQRLADRQHSPDPVRSPHDYTLYMMKGSPLSAPGEPSPVAQRHDTTPSGAGASLVGNVIPGPLSPLIFSDVFYDDSSSLSPQTEGTVSPTEAPTSAATIYTTDAPQTPGQVGSRRRSRSFSDSITEVSTHKRRINTLPDIRSEPFFDVTANAAGKYSVVGGDNRCLLRDEFFVERAPTPKMAIDMTTHHALPELSSFRPTDINFQDQTGLSRPSQKLLRTPPINGSSAHVPDTPAWMRSMHLVDAGGMSIYMNVHDDGPIRHALCLWCFRTHGDFCKVHRHGCESCGRNEVLDSHYWESDTWPEDSSDDSTSSDD